MLWSVYFGHTKWVTLDSLIITDCFKFDTAVDSGQVQEKVTLCNEWLNEIAVQPEYIPLLMVRTCALADLVVSLILDDFSNHYRDVWLFELIHRLHQLKAFCKYTYVTNSLFILWQRVFMKSAHPLKNACLLQHAHLATSAWCTARVHFYIKGSFLLAINTILSALMKHNDSTPQWKRSDISCTMHQFQYAL